MYVMRRPSDQAKLLLLGLLKTVSALATESKLAWPAVGTAAAHHYHNNLNNNNNHNHINNDNDGSSITLRLARRTDVPSLQRCNLASLPENYNAQFYIQHLRQWPELAIVAECHDENNNNNNNNNQPLFGSFPTNTPEPNIVAYVLGKVEDRLVSSITDDNTHYEVYTTEREGHVISLAVLEPYRRLGLAQALMEQLHLHMQSQADVSVGLHVRPSNRGANRLYEKLGYDIVEHLSNYYQDGEDAYLRKKVIPGVATEKSENNANNNNNVNNNNLWNAWRRRNPHPWEQAGPWQLPRTIVSTDAAENVQQEQTFARDQREQSNLLTGTA